MDAVDVRTQNLSAVMRAHFTGRADTRQALAEATGLTRMTITNLTNELLARGFLVEEEPSERAARPGRVAKTLRLAPDGPVVIGLWVARTFVFGVIADVGLNIEVGRRVPFGAETADSLTAKVAALAEELIAQARRPVLGLGLALTGVVDPVSGSIERATDFHGIDRLPIAERLAERVDVPIVAHNVMHAASLAELHYGVGREVSDFIYVGLSDGVGGSVVSGGRPVGAARMSGAEFGHMSIDHRGTPCSCGSRGCLERYAALPTLVAAISDATGASYASFQQALEACARDDRAAAALSSTLRVLAVGLNNLVNLMDVFTIVVGDDGYHIPDPFLAELAGELNELSLFRGLHEITVRKASFRDDGPLFGAVALVMDGLFTGATPL